MKACIKLLSIVFFAAVIFFLNSRISKAACSCSCSNWLISGDTPPLCYITSCPPSAYTKCYNLWAPTHSGPEPASGEWVALGDQCYPWLTLICYDSSGNTLPYNYQIQNYGCVKANYACDTNANCGAGYVCINGGTCNSYCLLSCAATAPTLLTATKTGSPAIYQFSWKPGTGGTRHDLSVCTDSGRTTCPYTASVANATPLQTTMTADLSLTPGVYYYWKVVNYNSATCSQTTNGTSFLSSCDVDNPAMVMQPGDTQTLSINASSSAVINRVDFIPSSAFVSANPTSDSSYIYQSVISAVSMGTGTVTANVRDASNNLLCSSISNVTVTAPDPWWQVIDGDVTTNGDLWSQVPVGSYFDEVGAGGFPGVPSYGSTTNLNQTEVNASALGWLAGSPYASTKMYNSSYFINSIPNEALAVTQSLPSTVDQTSFQGATPYGGVYWYEYDPSQNGGADLTVGSDLNFGSNKVVLVVKGADTYINGNINITDGSGFFMLVAGANGSGSKGNIIVSPTVGGGVGPNLEGIYVADNLFQTGTTATQNDSALHIRGTVAAFGGVYMQRDLGTLNGTQPAEIFEYAPDLELLFPRKISLHPMSWREVAP